ncbi:MAG: ABC transporter permease [Acholeplasmatales bacterium]|nr:ABC transporter permease [Acholeplasmatales bacterium]
MFFIKMIIGLYRKQFKKMLMIAITVMLGASIATAMLNVMLDVGDKINAELKSYGSNISVVSKSASVLSSLYEFEDTEESLSPDEYIVEEDIGKIKTVFWAFNITDVAPTYETYVTDSNGSKVKVVGAWFNHHLLLPTKEEVDLGITSMRSWWTVDGNWLDEQVAVDDAGNTIENLAMVGADYAKANNISVGDEITLSSSLGDALTQTVKVYGIYSSGDDEDSYIYTYLDFAQAFTGMDEYVKKIEVSALTTPDNELAKRAAIDPTSLTSSEYDLWYCTAYVSSICYQIMEVMPDTVASAVRQIADAESNILEKTELLMQLIAIVSIIAAALGISNLVTSSVMDRSAEIGLMKAIGAKNNQITVLVLLEVVIVAIIGNVFGYFLGYGFAQLIGHTVFGASVDMNGIVAVVVSFIIIVVTLIGSIPAVRLMLRLKPQEVLHGK